jgi:alkanesulfonate monooxygenase
MKVSDSHWHRQLSELERADEEMENPYWLGPFREGQTFCPYLVGSHGRVGAEIDRYISAGFETFILDIPPDEEELHHTGLAFAAATRS